MILALLIAAVFAALSRAQEPVGQLFRNAVEAQQHGEYDRAIQIYKQILRREPNLVDAQANLGVVLVQLGRFDEAVTAYEAALKQDPSNAPLRLNLALAFYKKGDLKNAAAEFERLHNGDPDNERIATLLGDCYLRLGRNSDAEALAAPLHQRHPDNADLSYVLGSALIANGKQREGVVLVEGVAKSGNAADAYLLAGRTRLKLDEYAAAVQDLDAAVSLDPNLPEVFTLRGVAREGAGDTIGAEADLRKALERNPGNFEANAHLGAILYIKRDLPAAKTFLDRAFQVDPSSNFVLYELALWKSASGQLKEAVSDLETVVRKDPNWLQAHVQLAALYYRVHRPEDGQREKQIVDHLTAEQQKAESAAAHAR